MIIFVHGRSILIGLKIFMINSNNFKIPFFDFKLAPYLLKEEWKREINNVIDYGQFINGPLNLEFEKLWCDYLKVSYSIGTSNGLDGLEIALRAVGIKEGMKVAVPAHTFIATWIAIVNVGAIPIGIDVDSRGLMNLEQLFTKDVECVIPVHMHGAMVNMELLMNWAKKHNVKVIEDCAQAHGSELKKRKAGSWGDIGVFSFYPTKNLGAIGDAGVIVTADEYLANSIRSLCNYGSDLNSKYHHSKIGFNRRLDTIQAGILKINLKYLDQWNLKRKILANLYIEELQLLNIDIVQRDDSVFHHFCISHPERDQLKYFLGEKGIGTEIHYPINASTEMSKILNFDFGFFPNASLLSKNILSLPISPWHSIDQISYVIECVKEFEL